MTLEAAVGELQSGTIPYVAPFIAYVGLLAMQHFAQLPQQVFYPTHTVLSAAVIWFASRRVLKLRPMHIAATAGVGLAVLLIWIAPDVLFGYRHHWIFENSLTGEAASVIPLPLRTNAGFLAVCFVRSAVAVPILEELFWRGWLMRWLIDTKFQTVPFGAYSRSSFWITAVLFASEHGPYWEVGLFAGVIYNWWAIRTKSLADCILAHAVTNLLLGVFVVAAGQWQFWI